MAKSKNTRAQSIPPPGIRGESLQPDPTDEPGQGDDPITREGGSSANAPGAAPPPRFPSPIPEESEQGEEEEQRRSVPPPSPRPQPSEVDDYEHNATDFLAAFKELSDAERKEVQRVINARHGAKQASQRSALVDIDSEGTSSLLFSEEAEEVLTDSFGPKAYKLHHDVRRLVELKVYLPISLFLNKSISDISLTSIPRETIVVKGVKSHVIKVDFFPDERKLDPTDWMEAWVNYLEFFRVVASPAVFSRWERHYKILSSRENFRDNFTAILRFDIRYRREYNANPFQFDQAHFDRMFVEVRDALRDERARDLEDRFRRFGRPAEGGVVRSQTRSLYRHDPYPVSSSSPGSAAGPNPFRKGSGDGRSSDPICLICARTGHKFSECSFQKTDQNKATFCRHLDRKIVSVSSAAPICILFNLRGSAACTREHPEQHLCSFCGARSHHTCSRICTKSSTYSSV